MKFKDTNSYKTLGRVKLHCFMCNTRLGPNDEIAIMGKYVVHKDCREGEDDRIELDIYDPNGNIYGSTSLNKKSWHEQTYTPTPLEEIPNSLEEWCKKEEK